MRSIMFTMGGVFAFSFMFCFEASFTASALTDTRRLSSLSFVGWNPGAYMPLSKFVKNRRTRPFQPYMSDVLDDDNKTEELRMDTAASNEKESVKLANDAVKLANDAVKLANDAVALAFEGLRKAQIELDLWNERVNSNLNNPALLSLYITERDKASERLKEARESLKEANELLKEARAYRLQLTQNSSPVGVSDKASNLAATIGRKDVLEDISDGDGTDTTVSELERSLKLANDAEAKAQEDLNRCSDDVNYYAEVVEKFERKKGFTGKETQYLALKQSQKEARESLDKATTYKLQLTQNARSVAVSAEAVLEATERARNFVAAIMKEDVLEDIPDSFGMKVMRNIPKLETYDFGVVLRDVVIRNITDKFWQACIDTVATIGNRVCAVGTPGIGKTAATPYLIRMLLKRGNTVVYLIRSPGERDWYYEFTPSGGSIIDVAVHPERKFEGEIPCLKKSSTYFVVDPGITKDNCVRQYLPAKFILVSSPNDIHWGGSDFRKDRDGIEGFFLYFPLWTLEELKQASTILNPSLTDESIYERYRHFGGVPRAIFKSREYDFNSTLSDQDKALSSITAEMAESMYYGKLDAVGSFGSNIKSAVMGFNLSESDNFKSGVSVIISAVVYEKVCSKYMANLWNLIILDEVRGRTLFEAYVRLQMSTPYQNRDYLARSCVGATDELYKETGYLRLGGCKSIRVAVDIVDAAMKSPGDLFHSSDQANPLIDFIYQDERGIFHAFHATVGKDHDANSTQIKALENRIEDAENNLKLYYVVPSENFATFVTNPREPDVTCSIYHVLIPRPGKEKETESGNRRKPGERQSRLVLESYIQTQMTQRNQTVEFLVRPCVGRKDDLYNKTMNLTLGGCNSTQVVHDIVYSAKNLPGILFQAEKTNELINFMYQDNEGIFHAFKSMLGKQEKLRKLNVTQLRDLGNQIKDARNKLRIYCLVREEKFAEFVTSPVKPNVSYSVYHLQVPNPKKKQTEVKIAEMVNEEVALLKKQLRFLLRDLGVSQEILDKADLME